MSATPSTPPSPSSLEEQVFLALKAQNATVTTAESCTGGLIAEKITRIAGSSAVFGFGWITYANQAKTQLLGVDKKILENAGAVSEETVLAMAKGALARSKATYALAVSGIAGPSGEEEGKPVGTVWIAWGKKAQEEQSTDIESEAVLYAKRFLFDTFPQETFRKDFREKVAQTALEGLLALMAQSKE